MIFYIYFFGVITLLVTCVIFFTYHFAQRPGTAGAQVLFLFWIKDTKGGFDVFLVDGLLYASGCFVLFWGRVFFFCWIFPSM